MEPRQGPVRKNLIAVTPISRQVKNKNKQKKTTSTLTIGNREILGCYNPCENTRNFIRYTLLQLCTFL